MKLNAKWIQRLFFGFCLIILTSNTVWAGSPLYMADPMNPLIWNTAEPIQYKIDAKAFGKLTQEQSINLVQEALAIWQAVPGTGIQFKYLGLTDEPITVNNWEDIAANHVYTEADGETPVTTDSQRNHYLVIGFDNDGEIIKAKGSSGASGVQSLTGVSGTATDPGFIISGHLFLNGLYYNGNNSDIEDLTLTGVLAILVHEIGHALGLDHNPVHFQMYQDILNGQLDKSYTRFFSVMFPRYIRGTGDHMVTLNPDDIATLQWMYGGSEVRTISGEITDAAGSPQYSMFVTAREVTSSLCQAYSQATRTTCSDMNTSESGDGIDIFNGKFCMDDTVTGKYIIPVLYDGDYTVDVQEIDSSFLSAISKFGGHIIEMPGNAEFYSHNDRSIENSYAHDEILIDGQDEFDVNIVLSSTSPSPSDIDRIDYTYFIQNTFFDTLSEDVDCPLRSDIDYEDIILNSASNNLSDPPSNAAQGGGCSLVLSQRSNIEGQKSFIYGFLILMITLALFKRKNVNHKNI